MMFMAKLLLTVIGLYMTIEGVANITYWYDKPTKKLFQAGRIIRAIGGVIILFIVVFGV